MNVRYIRTKDDRKENEYCIDLIEGFFTPSWQALNLSFYALGSKKIPEGLGVNRYKEELFFFWDESRIYADENEEHDAKRAKLFLRTVLNADEDVALACGSIGPTVWSDAFMAFVAYIGQEEKNE